MVIFFVVTLASCISPWLISSFLFAFRFPVIRFVSKIFVGSRVMVTSVIETPAHYKSCVCSKILMLSKCDKIFVHVSQFLLAS